MYELIENILRDVDVNDIGHDKLTSSEKGVRNIIMYAIAALLRPTSVVQYVCGQLKYTNSDVVEFGMRH